MSALCYSKSAAVMILSLKSYKFHPTSHMKLKYFYQYILLILAAILITSSWFTYRNLRSNLEQEVQISAQDLSNFSNTKISSNGHQPSTISLIEENAHFAAVKIQFPNNILVRAGVLEIEFDDFSDIHQNNLYIRLVQAVPTKESTFVPNSLHHSNNQWLPVRADNPVYRIPLFRDKKKNNVILEIKYENSLKQIPIHSITVKSASYFDFPPGALLISLAVVFSIFVPGLILCLVNPQQIKLPLPITAFIYSLPLNLLSFATCHVIKNDLFFIPLLCFSTASIAFVIRDKRQSFKAKIQFINKKYSQDITVWVAVTTLICLAMSFSYPAVTPNLHQEHLTREHTFKAFGAHDAVFQFYNSKAIIEKDFAKYYGNSKLMFQPQDREILPGLSYAATTVFLKNIFGNNLSQTYFPYAVFFLLCHALILNILFTWFKDFDSGLAAIVTFVVATTPVFWVTGMIGWFKLTGSALTLSGIYLIRKNPTKWRYWLFAGILFGLAKNYHGGNALVLPLLTIWMLYVTYRYYQPISFKKLIINFFTVTAATCTVIYPWVFYIKKVWGTGSHLLFSFHFLGGHYLQDSIFKSMQAFFQQIPLQEQIPVRFERLLNIFNYDLLNFLAGEYGMRFNSPLEGLLQFTPSYFLPAILPYAIIALVIAYFIKRLVSNNGIPTTKVHNPWLDHFGIICFLNVLLLTFLSYGDTSHYPAITWEIPSLLIIGILAQFIYWSCKSNITNKLIWLCLGCFQLGLIVAYG